MNLLFTVYRSSFFHLRVSVSPCLIFHSEFRNPHSTFKMPPYLLTLLFMSPPLHPIPGCFEIDIDDRGDIERDEL